MREQGSGSGAFERVQQEVEGRLGTLTPAERRQEGKRRALEEQPGGWSEQKGNGRMGRWRTVARRQKECCLAPRGVCPQSL